MTVPEGFSPNGDNVNDQFVIDGLEYYPDNRITIFNRWGQKVFESAPYANNWDGTSQNSMTIGNEKLPEGTYFYLLDLGNGDVMKGYIYLTR